MDKIDRIMNNFIIANHSESEMNNFIQSLQYDELVGKNQRNDDCAVFRFKASPLIQTSSYVFEKQDNNFMYFTSLDEKDLYFFKKLDEYGKQKFKELCTTFDHVNEKDNIEYQYKYKKLVKTTDHTYVKLRYDSKLKKFYNNKETQQELIQDKKMRLLFRIVELPRFETNGYLDILVEQIYVDIEEVKRPDNYAFENVPVLQFTNYQEDDDVNDTIVPPENHDSEEDADDSETSEDEDEPEELTIKLVEVEEPVKVVETNKCEYCSFTAKNKQGLNAHLRSCKKKNSK